MSRALRQAAGAQLVALAELLDLRRELEGGRAARVVVVELAMVRAAIDLVDGLRCAGLLEGGAVADEQGLPPWPALPDSLGH